MTDATEPIRVLHVDDEPDFVDMAAAFVEREDGRIAVQTATSASEGLDRLATGAFDCVVSDYDLPGETGLDFLEAVREEHPDLPFLLYTGKGSEEVASEAISAGVTDYLQKGTGTSQYELLCNRIRNAVEQRRARDVAAETERRLQTIAEHTSDVLWMFDDDWTELRFVNSAYEDVWGRSTDELGEQPRSFLNGVHPDDRPHVRRSMARVSAGESVDIEYRVNADEDFGRWVWVRGEPVRGDAGGVVGVVGFARDVTDHRRAERELEQQAARLETFSTAFPDVAFVVDDDGQFLDVIAGERSEELLYEEPAAFLGQSVHDVFPDDLADDAVSTVRTAIDTGETRQYEYSLDLPRGERWFDALVEPLPSRVVGTEAVVWVARDVTDQHERERALERLHAATRDLMAATTTTEIVATGSETAAEILNLPLNSLHLFDPETEVLVPAAWSEAVETMFGGPPPSIPAGEGIAWHVYTTGDSRNYADVRESGRVLNEDTAVRSELCVPLGDHGVLMAASTTPDAFDATDESLAHVLAANVEAALDRVEREQTLAEERDKYETVVERSHDAIAIHRDGEFVFANERCLELLGYEAFELVGAALVDIVVPEDRDLVRERYERRLDPEAEPPPAQYEIRVLTGDGQRRVAEVSAASILYEGQPAVLVMARDVTERRRYEERLKEMAEELEALNRIVRHDIRNDMSVVLGWAQLLDDHVDDAGRGHLRKILASGEHIVELTDIARDYVEMLTSNSGVELKPVPLRSTLDTELALRRESFPAASFVTRSGIPDVEVVANGMLGSVFANLLNNAVQHNDADEPVVELTCDVRDEDVVVRIADNGQGVPDRRKEAVFGKGDKGLESPGTGIGLYLVRTLVDQYGGDVWVEDNDPTGAVFAVQLPLVD